jgi:hypothetical protein
VKDGVSGRAWRHRGAVPQHWQHHSAAEGAAGEPVTKARAVLVIRSLVVSDMYGTPTDRSINACALTQPHHFFPFPSLSHSLCLSCRTLSAKANACLITARALFSRLGCGCATRADVQACATNTYARHQRMPPPPLLLSCFFFPTRLLFWSIVVTVVVHATTRRFDETLGGP